MEIADLLEYADITTQMTLAPELPGALDLIERLCARAIIHLAAGLRADLVLISLALEVDATYVGGICVYRR